MSVDFDPCVLFFYDCLAYVLYKGQTGGRKVGALLTTAQVRQAGGRQANAGRGSGQAANRRKGRFSVKTQQPDSTGAGETAHKARQAAPDEALPAYLSVSKRTAESVHITDLGASCAIGSFSTASMS